MARTSLLNMLQQWARELEAQESSDARNQSRSAHPLTRREFIAGLGAVGALAVLPKWAKAGVKPRIAIVGGGIAGLSCALALHDRGVEATIYEASHRVGGRMFSNARYWDDGQVSEWCGELIDSGHKTILKLAQRFRLPVDDLLAAEPEGAEETYYFSQHPNYSYADAKADFAAIYKQVKDDLQAAGYPTRYDRYTEAGKKLDEMSIVDWIEAHVPGGHDSAFGQLLDVAYVIEFGAAAAEQSALNLLYLLAYQPNSGANAKAFGLFGVSDERYHIRDGNERLPRAIRDYLGKDWFRFGAELTKIARTSDQRYQLQFSTGGNTTETALFDYVVLAIPFAVLREIDYSEAGFDSLKDKAIQKLGRARSGKLQLQFASRYWNQPVKGRISSGSTYSDTGYQSSWEVTRAQSGDAGILNLFSGGDTSAAMQTDRPFATAQNQDVLTDAGNGLVQLGPVFPDIGAEWNQKATQSLPHRSRFFKASYAYYGVGQYTEFGGYEGVSQGNVLFCGEHTSQDFQGYMEGGASEGQRAAKELLKAL